MTKRYVSRETLKRRNALALALAVGLGFTGFGYAQSTVGQIFGRAPATSGQTVKVTGTSGTARSTTVDADGSYSFRSLPVGSYTVTLMDKDAVVSTRKVTVTPGGGSDVSFTGGSTDATELKGVSVTANALPAIDVRSVASSYVVTSEELAKLPIGRSAEAIALLSPGVVSGSGFFGNVLTVNGAGATENAYYVNGYNTTALYDYTGSSYQLPYGAIAQQETIIGGYDARYGRSDGGVINQIGKRGSNEWHFGAQALWEPRSLNAGGDNSYYPYIGGTGDELDYSGGDLLRYREDNTGWRTKYSAYVGGPIVPDTLFFYIAAEQSRNYNSSVATASTGSVNKYKVHDTRWYGKLDWNINENNILEYTQLKDNTKGGGTGGTGYGRTYAYDNDTRVVGNLIQENSYNVNNNDTSIFHYTGYLSDAATLSVLYGHTEVSNPLIVPGASADAFISAAGSQDPSLNGGKGIRSGNRIATINSPLRASSSKSLRVDFDYQLADHLLQVGIDNVTYTANGQGRVRSGPGYIWIYGVSTIPSTEINTQLGVGAPGGNGYYVDRSIFDTLTDLGAEQKAYYFQDQWQVSSNVLLKLGIRNDTFRNFNGDNEAFVVQKNQWEPRLGFSWDVNGDSTLKVYGNVGRYYLALPQSVGERAATQSTNTNEYFTYTGIDPATGAPTGLTPVQGSGGGAAPGQVSINNEFGQSPVAKEVASTTLKPQYQDEYILGFDKALGTDWAYGAKLTYRQLGTVIDDECDPNVVGDQVAAMGLDRNNYKWNDPGCRIFNPNSTNTFVVSAKDGSAPINVSVTQAQFQMPSVQREYYGLDLFLAHPFDGKWSGRIDYTFSRSWGNAEGQVRSDLAQTDTSKTEDWDHWALMDHSRGYLANDRRHVLKAHGIYQVTPEWSVSGNLLLSSGSPQNCLGLFGPNETDPAGYGADYHWCQGKIAQPGKDRNPWMKQLDLGVGYQPAFADSKLAFGLQFVNVTNEQVTLQTNPRIYNRNGTALNAQYRAGQYFQQPRYVQATVSYDF